MTETTKLPNYTDEQTATLVNRYQAAENDAEREEVIGYFAELFGKTVRSIRAKLSTEKVYVKKAKVDKTGKPVTKKADFVRMIAERASVLLGETIDEESLESLEKANKSALRIVRSALSVACDWMEAQNEVFPGEPPRESDD